MHRKSQPHRRGEAGFTLVEVTVAAFVMVVGLLGTLSMLDSASLATASTKAREQGVALQRELVEAARSLPYDELVPGGVVPAIQSHPDLGDAQPGTPGWQISRRGVVYTVSVGACSIDDPSDGTGDVDDATFCPSSSGTPASTCTTLLGPNVLIQGIAGAAGSGLAVGNCGLDLNLDGEVDELTRSSLASNVDLCAAGYCPTDTTDHQPDDYKRVVTLVTWDRGTGTRYSLQSTTVPNPGSAAAPQVSVLSASSPLNVTTGDTVAFSATTSRPAATVSWSVDGNAEGTASGAQTGWTFNWALGDVSSGSTPNPDEIQDGVYVVGAKAFDPFGVSGEARSLTISLNRRAPYQPTDFSGGRDVGGSGGSGVVDFEWNPNAARDIVGYRVYRVPATGSPVQVCPATSGDTVNATSCQASGEPGDDQLTYYVVAVDHDPSGTLREGPASDSHVVTLTNTAPAPASSLTATPDGEGNTVLQWAASPGDPDTGDSVDFYRIYRDGTAYSNRYDRTGTGAELTYTDTNTGGVSHVYRVVAVDTQLAESAFSDGASG
jgi:Tfp pilus assembly protein PilV